MSCREQCPVSRLLALLFLLLLWAKGVNADGPFLGPMVENEHVRVMLVPRTPEQMAAFYEARGFPKLAIEQTRKSCFITTLVTNKSDEVIWLETINWRFLGSTGRVIRHDREYWRDQWIRLNVPKSARATFGWTLLPDVRDLQPGEPAGGNITIAQTNAPFMIDIRMLTGKNKRGDQLHIQFENIHCPRDRVAK